MNENERRELVRLREWIEMEDRTSSIPTFCNAGNPVLVTASIDDDGQPSYVEKEVDQEELFEGGTIRYTITDETVDRQGDIIRIAGWDYRDYLRNPVVLWAHNSRDVPVAKAISVTRSRKELTLKSVAEFPSADLYEFGNTIFRMAANGFLKAVSVGFIPKEYEPLDPEDPWGGYEFKKQELYEYSVVPVPANPNALQNAARVMPGGAKFIIEWAEKILDEAKDIEGHEDLERQRKEVAGNVHVVSIADDVVDGLVSTFQETLKGIGGVVESVMEPERREDRSEDDEEQFKIDESMVPEIVSGIVAGIKRTQEV